MENNPKKSKAFILAFILILLLLIAGYYLFANRAKIFNTKGVVTMQKVFAPLLGSSKNKDLNVIGGGDTGTGTTDKTITGVIITDQNGNKIIQAEAGENLKKGDVLYIVSFNKKDTPIVMKAIANDKKKSLVFGVAGEDMNKGTLGNIIIEGILSGVPTNRTEVTLWAPNNPLYLSDKIYGGMTKNPPYAPSFIVPVGSVISIDAINGSIRIGGILNDANISSDHNIQSYYNSIFGMGNDKGNKGNNNNDFILNPITIPGNDIFSNNLPKVTVVASPSSIDAGGSSIISWISTKATVCNAGAGNGTGTTGSFKTGPLTKSKSYAVSCTGANGSISSGNTFVLVVESNPCLNGATNYPACDNTSSLFPSVKVTAKPASVKEGGSTVVSWTSTKSVSCDAGEGNGKGIKGSFKTGALMTSTSYSVICTDAKGSESSGNVYISVIIPSGPIPPSNTWPTIKAKATPVSIKLGGTSTISWTSKNTTSCYAGIGASTETNASFITEALNESRSYTITCKGGSGEVSSDAYVNVSGVFKFPIVTVTATPPSVNSGDTSIISWTSTNTTSCNAGAGKGTGTSGSFKTNPLTKTTSYTVVCIGPNGQKGGNTSVSINSDPNGSGKPECSDGKDNNGNRLIDINEPNCHIDGDLNKEYIPTNPSESIFPTECSDGIDNNGNGLIDKKDPNCHVGGDLKKEYVPTHISESVPPTQCSDKVDNDADGKVDAEDPDCHTDGDMTKEYVPTHNSEKDPPTSPFENTCKLIDSTPLEFNDIEKAQLDELLRKFYLIAPSLRTEDDINIAYSEITQYKNFSEHLGTLINQCYTQSGSADGTIKGIVKINGEDTLYKGPTTRHGNPWYKYSTDRGSYIKLPGASSANNTGRSIFSRGNGGSSTPLNTEGDFDCKYISGWFSGNGADGKSCDTYNTQLYTPQTPASCTTSIKLSSNPSRYSRFSAQDQIYQKGLKNKCIWNPGAKITDLEKIFNVW